MRDHRLEKFSFIVTGILISALFCGLAFSFMGEEKKTPRELASIELDLRQKIKAFKRNYNVKMGLIRNSDSITLRIWDKGVFPVNDWRLSNNGESFVSDLVKVIDELESNSEVKIDSHYDSVNPIKKGDKELNKIKISNYRAAQVANIFAHKGFDIEKISYRGFSDKSPIVKDRDVFGNYISKAGSINRRVEITIKTAGEGI